jgi:4-amino-4-deoxy-L-arabinose transferase-like glycosyltransferase
MLSDNRDYSAIVIMVVFAIARLLFALCFGFGIDESYTIAISRVLCLSYFDHPPLHLWISHLSALLFGENQLIRVPFILIFSLVGWIYYCFTKNLFGRRPALIAMFALNVTPFFFASAGGWVVPDGPLLFGLVLSAWAASRLLFHRHLQEVSVWGCWSLLGFGLGVAGLSKYSAILVAAGFVAFVVLSHQHRHWLKHPAPYVSVIIAIGTIMPVILWNAKHDWVSFKFQGARGMPAGQFHPTQWATMVLGEVAFLSPWIFALAIASLISAIQHWRDERRMFLLCLSLPTIIFFSLTPLWGSRGQPHWTMPGWFFTFALIGLWAEERAISTSALRRWAVVSAALLAGIAGLAAAQASTGWPLGSLAKRFGAADPLLESFEWTALTNAPIFSNPPNFAIATKWSDAGKIALALGPDVPVFVLSDDPRGWAFLHTSEGFLGKDGVIITPAKDAARVIAAGEGLFARLGPPQIYQLGRQGRAEVDLALIPAINLTRGLPMPYPSARSR